MARWCCYKIVYMIFVQKYVYSIFVSEKICIIFFLNLVIFCLISDLIQVVHRVQKEFNDKRFSQTTINLKRKPHWNKNKSSFFVSCSNSSKIIRKNLKKRMSKIFMKIKKLQINSIKPIDRYIHLIYTFFNNDKCDFFSI